MSIKVKVSGAYADPSAIKVKVNGSYQGPVGIYAKVDGVYQVVGGASPLRTVSTQNRIMTDVYTTTEDRYRQRVQKQVAQDTKDLVINLHNFQAQPTQSLPNVNTVTYSGMYVEVNGVTFQVTLNGQASFTIAANATDINSDPIPASVINGTSKIDKGTLYWIKWENPVTVGDKLFYNAEIPTAVIGQQVWRYTAANTVLNPLSAAGPSTVVSGPAATSMTTNFFAEPMGFGHPVIDEKSFLGVGDSIPRNVGDTGVGSGNGVTGNGMFQRAMSDGTTAGLIPSLNTAVSGATVTYFNSVSAATYLHPYIKYCNNAVEELLTNFIGLTPGALTLATCQAAITPVWTILKSNGINKIIRTELLPRTTSTDNWLTDINQTTVQGWGVGEVAAQCNAWFYTARDAGLIDVVVPMDFVKSVSNRQLWKTDGLTQRLYIAPSSVDPTTATHPNPDGHTGLSLEIRAATLAL